MSTFFGMRGTGDFVANETPENWRKYIFEMVPNGNTPILNLTSMGRGEPTDSSTFHWWDRTMAVQAGSITDVYIDTALATPYVRVSHQATFGIAGGVVQCKVAEATSDMFRIGHTAIIRDSDRPGADVYGRVTNIVKNGSSSIVSVKLLEADDNDADYTNYGIATADRILVAGNMFGQGAPRPKGLTFDPTELFSYTGIFRTPLDISRSAKKEANRARDPYQDLKDQALLYHGVEMELALLYATRYKGTDEAGKVLTHPMGLLQYIKTYAPSNVNDFRYNTDFTGYSWVNGGYDWFLEQVQNIAAYVPEGEVFDSTQRAVLCGAGVLTALGKMAKGNASINLIPTDIGYGVKTKVLQTPHLDLHFMKHPLFVRETTMNNACVVVAPEMIVERVFEETMFKPDMSERQGGNLGIDGTQEEWLTEIGWEFHHAPLFAYWTGVGLDNNLT